MITLPGIGSIYNTNQVSVFLGRLPFIVSLGNNSSIAPSGAVHLSGVWGQW